VYSHSGELKAIQKLDANLLLQPEGICFSPDGTMYISTEGKHGTPAAIYQFNSK
jgi:sugar lactone lactonase YvrE